jgi:hypothetical protein
MNHDEKIEIKNVKSHPIELSDEEEEEEEEKPQRSLFGLIELPADKTLLKLIHKSKFAISTRNIRLAAEVYLDARSAQTFHSDAAQLQLGFFCYSFTCCILNRRRMSKIKTLKKSMIPMTSLIFSVFGPNKKLSRNYEHLLNELQAFLIHSIGKKLFCELDWLDGYKYEQEYHFQHWLHRVRRYLQKQQPNNKE